MSDNNMFKNNKQQRNDNENKPRKYRSLFSDNNTENKNNELFQFLCIEGEGNNKSKQTALEGFQEMDNTLLILNTDPSTQKTKECEDLLFNTKDNKKFTNCQFDTFLHQKSFDHLPSISSLDQNINIFNTSSQLFNQNDNQIPKTSSICKSNNNCPGTLSNYTPLLLHNDKYMAISAAIDYRQYSLFELRLADYIKTKKIKNINKNGIEKKTQLYSPNHRTNENHTQNNCQPLQSISNENKAKENIKESNNTIEVSTEENKKEETQKSEKNLFKQTDNTDLQGKVLLFEENKQNSESQFSNNQPFVLFSNNNICNQSNMGFTGKEGIELQKENLPEPLKASDLFSSETNKHQTVLPISLFNESSSANCNSINQHSLDEKDKLMMNIIFNEIHSQFDKENQNERNAEDRKTKKNSFEIFLTNRLCQFKEFLKFIGKFNAIADLNNKTYLKPQLQSKEIIELFKKNCFFNNKNSCSLKKSHSCDNLNSQKKTFSSNKQQLLFNDISSYRKNSDISVFFDLKIQIQDPYKVSFTMKISRNAKFKVLKTTITETLKEKNKKYKQLTSDSFILMKKYSIVKETDIIADSGLTEGDVLYVILKDSISQKTLK